MDAEKLQEYRETAKRSGYSSFQGSLAGKAVLELCTEVERLEKENTELKQKVEDWQDAATKAEHKASDCQTKLSHALHKLKELGFEPKHEPLWGESAERERLIEQARQALESMKKGQEHE